MPCPSAIGDLDLCETTIHKQFRPRDVAAVVGREKHDGLRDLIWCPEPAKRNDAGNHLPALRARFREIQQVIQSGRVDRPWAYRVHANATLL